MSSDVPCPHCLSPNPLDATHCRTCGAPLSSDTSAALPVGSRLRGGQYVIENVLGEGGFGITYRALDTSLGAAVAIKELFPASASRDATGRVQYTRRAQTEAQKLRERFKQEALLLLRLRHPAVVRVLGVFEERDTAYLVMELLEGETLHARLTHSGALPEAEVQRLLGPLLGALEEMHAQGTLHRDIKPENVMLTRSGPVLIDFGTALGYTANQTLVVTSQVLTPAYAPLEQYASAARLGPPTDLYALGATLYHAVTGRVPVSSMDRASGIALAGVRTLAPQLSAPLAGVIERCLALQVADRPQTAEAVRAALGGIPSVPPMTVPGQASLVNQVGSPPLAPTVFVQPAGSSPAPAPVVATPSVQGSPAPSSVSVARRRQPAISWWLLAGLLVLGGGAAWWLTRPTELTGTPVTPVGAQTGTSNPVVTRRVEVRATELNVRKGPGTNHPVIRIGTANLRVSRGAELEVEESQNGWYRVKVNGTDGWISGRLTLPLSPTVDDAELNRAIQAIEAGGRVDLRAGVYLVPRTLTPGPSLALVGMDMDETYLVSAGDSAVLRYRGPGSFAARDLTFGYRGSAWTSVVTLEDAEFDLERTRFIGAWDGDDPAGSEGDGLAVLGQSVGQVRSSEFLTNRWRGLSVSDASAVTISDSAFQFNDGSGLVLNDQAQANLERSRATGNRLQGFKALGQARLSLVNSAAQDNRSGGIAFDEAASGRLERTDCGSNEGFALRVQTSARVELDSSPSCRITPKAQVEVTPQAITLAEASTVADEYLTLGAMDDLSWVGEVYADQIRYYDRGLVSRPAVLADKLAYYGRWSQRQYARVSAVRSLPTRGGGRRVEFEYEFRVSDPFRDEAAGKARVVLGLERQGGRVRIVEENGEVIERY